MDAGSEQIALELYSLSQSLNGDLGAAEYLQCLLGYFYRSGEIELADSLLSPYVDRVDELDDLMLKFDVFKQQSVVDEYEGNFEAAVENMRIAIDYLEQAGNPGNYGIPYQYLGRNLIPLGRFSESGQAFNRAIENFKIANDSVGLEETYLDMAILFSMIGLYDDAEKYILERQQYFAKGDPTGKVLDYSNLARNDLLMEKYQAAIDKSLYALSFKKISPEYQYAHIFMYNNLVEAHYYLGQKDSVVHYYNLLKSAYEKDGREDVFFYLLQQSRFLKNLIEGNYALAEKDGLELMASGREKQDIAEIAMYSRFLADLYKKTGQTDRAIGYIEDYTRIQDSTRSANMANALLLYQTQYETEKKEAAIAELEASNAIEALRRRQYGIIAIALAALLALGAVLLFFLQRARSTLKSQNLELAELNQTKDRFFGIIAHDLRSPLVALSNADNLLKHYIKKDDKEKLVGLGEKIGRTSKSLTGLLDNLLAWALQQTGRFPVKKQPIDLSETLEIVESTYSGNLALKNLNIRHGIDSNHKVMASPEAVETIFRNLIGNAIKFSPEGGNITVQAEKAGEKLCISIRDEGIGMNQEQLASLFSLDKKSRKGTAGEKGTGLGLILCKELAEAHGGSLEIKSEEGKGTECRVFLPEG